jgi:hypothetical protein
MAVATKKAKETTDVVITETEKPVRKSSKKVPL